MPAIEFLANRFDAGQTVAEMLHKRFRLTWTQARRLVERGHVRIAGMACADPAQRVRKNNRVWIRDGVIEIKQLKPPKPAAEPAEGEAAKPAAEKAARPKRAERPEAPLPPGLVLAYADEAVAVIDKPAGLTTQRHADEAAEFGPRGRAYLPRTLAEFLPQLLGEPGGRFYPVHRIDRDTTGLVVFARTAAAASSLTKQFRKHTVERRYVALVRGAPAEGRIESVLVPDRGDGRRGSLPAGRVPADDEARRAVTWVKVRERFAGAALVECRLETGRTHQVRIHLGEAGAPLCGERVYDRPLNGAPAPDPTGATRPMLHALELGFAHPDTGEHVEWEAPLPADFAALLKRLRAGASPASTSSSQ